MSPTLRVTLGQHSQAGRKAINQDFHGAATPTASQLGAKGLAIALAPSRIEQVLAFLATLGPDRRRLIGLTAVAFGVVLVWVAQRLLA